MERTRHPIPTEDGWTLDVRHYFDPDHLDEARRPVVAVPGYGMNCFILNYHPTDTPLVEHCVEAGLEVWTANLRGQGEAEPPNGGRGIGFSDLALGDLPKVLEFVLGHTHTDADRADLLGCSLGATLGYVYLAHNPDDHLLGAMVNVGGPLRWNRIHPAVRWATSCPPIWGALRIRGTRKLARLAMPVLRRFPRLLSLYINPDLVDLSDGERMAETIDDPDPKLSRQMAEWINNRDLVVDGLNISHSLYSVEIPLLCVIAMQDGIVTPESALSILDHIGSHETDVVEVGTYLKPHAHADLFISEGVRHKVFEPICSWLERVDDAE